MKKLMACIMTAVLLSSFIPAPVRAATPVSITNTTTADPVPSAEAKKLLTRLSEIKAIDKSGLSASEKKQLRKETRSIKMQLKQSNGGIYLSAGAVILIVILLIILL